ncbi:CwfJ C-terminus 2-domain-containing protein-like protein [Pseudomassariella vexata]|uniref:CwfJ C-terminus 2-domain-containing protein-like protein n=1 Tax=Pseudomassariella vexata TaxID=1141098 RepID=A0A1Y2DLU1_9PEZI|nr:CwfJ C-terminus 2-domain-containing protein-like protein [Pseudomassariella vexata]ORY60232.1 CwfJ C-terminus 2-domain-containing protein-like protein [Pseudomassariella vexata]
MAAKVIVLGSVNGKLAPAFQKLGTLHSKNKFSFAIVTGDLFGNDDDDESITQLLNGHIKVPLSTYFTVGTAPLPPRIVERLETSPDEDLCENLHFLGKRSITTTSDGIRIVALGGNLDTSIVGGQSKEQLLPYHTTSDATSLRGANKTDILLTSIWPAGVWEKSITTLTPENQAAVSSTKEIADLCAAIKPRYHFSSSPVGFFYEREPFFYSSAVDETSTDKQVTRFISMAPFGNPAKAKAMYAFNVQAGETASTIPHGSTMSPFIVKSGIKRGSETVTNEGGYSRFGNGTNHHDGRHSKRRHHLPPTGPSQCFFCLANANLETHMVESIGDSSYVAAAKGPLPSSNFFAENGLNFPCHQLIISFAHNATIREIALDPEAEDPNEGLKTYKEMARFRETMQAMVAKKSKFKLGAVTWEISRANNIHLHWQFLPVPIDLVRRGLVEAGFKVEAENRRYPAFQTQELDSAIDHVGDFLRVWIWSDDGDTGIQGKELVLHIDDSSRFDLQFPRKVLAKLLQLDNRFRWQDVVQSTQEETESANQFKEAFKPWDFTRET